MSTKVDLTSLIEARLNIRPTGPPPPPRPKPFAPVDFIDPRQTDAIKNLLASSPNLEIELNFGTFKEGDKYFTPGALSVWQFSALVKSLRELVDSGVASAIDEKTVVEVMRNVPKGDQRGYYRRVTFPDAPVKPGEAAPERWENKRRMKNEVVENEAWGYRIQKSEEYIVDSPPFAENTFIPDFVRVRRRKTFTPDSGSDLYGYQFDLSNILETKKEKGRPDYSITKYEIEIERVKSTARGMSVQTLFDHLENAIEFAMWGMQETVDPVQLISLPERLQLAKYHGVLYPSHHPNTYKLYKDYWNKPTNVQIKDLGLPKLNDYSITLKLDGVRRFIMVTPIATYSLSPPDDSWKIGRAVDSLDTTLLDAEYYQGDYYVFDIIYYDGKPVFGKPFKERLGMINAAVRVLKTTLYGGAAIMAKEFYVPGNGVSFYGNVRKAFDKWDTDAATGNVQYDGIILQPPDQYKNNRTWKWKPENQLTIDFEVAASDRPDEFRLLVGEKKGSIPFEGTKKHPYNKMVSIPDGKFQGMNAVGSIIEFKWDSDIQNFVPYRLREDRDRPNAGNTASDIWRDIMEPVTRQTMEGDTLLVMRKYHNDIKRGMLKTEFSEGDIIVDFGSGKGGDLGKWKDVGLGKIFVVEPNIINFEELEKRAKEMEMEGKYEPVLKSGLAGAELAGAEDKDDILAAIGDAKIAGIVAFFSLTFFGKNPQLFDELIDSIDAILPQGGKLVGIVMDGDTVREKLEAVPKEEGEAAIIATPSYTLEQSSRFSDEHAPEEGKNEIVIDIRGGATVNDQTEWLFYYTPFEAALKKRGIRPVRSALLEKGDGFNVLPPDSKAFSSLYRSFIFIREERKYERKAEKPLEELVPPDVLVPFTNIYDEDLYKIGIDRDRSAFIRAILRAFDSSYFIKDSKSRTEYVNKLRNVLSRKAADLDIYGGLNEGELSDYYTRLQLEDMKIKGKPSSAELEEAEEIGHLAYRLKIADADEHLNDETALDLVATVLGINIIVVHNNSEPDEKILFGRSREEYVESLDNKKTAIVIRDGNYYSLMAKKTDDVVYTMFEPTTGLVAKIVEKMRV